MTEAEFQQALADLSSVQFEQHELLRKFTDARTEVAAQAFKNDLEHLAGGYRRLEEKILAEFKRLKAIEEEPPVTRQIRTDRG